MKAKYWLSWMVVMLLLTGFSSCSDDDKEGTFDISRSDVHAMIGNKDNINILPIEGNYTVKALDESVATGEVKYTDRESDSTPLASVVVTPVSKGKTTFVISNGIEEKNVNITVVDPYIVFNVGHQIFSSIVDSDKTDGINTELKRDPFLSLNNIFMLVKDEACTMYLFESKDDVAIYDRTKSVSQSSYKLKGSYNIEKSDDKYYLVLKSGNQSSRFEIGGNAEGKYIISSFFNLNSLKSENTVPEFLAQIKLTEDLTEEYNIKFQGGISLVEREYTCTILSQRMYLLPFEE